MHDYCHLCCTGIATCLPGHEITAALQPHRRMLFDRTHRNMEHPGDFFVGVAMHFLQHKHLLTLRRQAGEGLTEQQQALLFVQRLFRRRRL